MSRASPAVADTLVDEYDIQLRAAPTQRVIVEHAKGVLAERGTLSMAAAFDRLRRHARNNNLRSCDLARNVVEQSATAAEVLNAPAAK